MVSLAGSLPEVDQDIPDSVGDLSRSGLPLVEAGFPPLNASDVPPCGIGIPGIPACDRAGLSNP